MRKLIKPLSGFILLIAYYNVYSQDTTSLQRTAYKLRIDVNNKTFYEEDLPAGRFVHPNNTVQLYPGETVYLEADVSDGKILKLRAVSSIKDSSTTIIASFNQTSNKKVHESMMLKLYNPFEQTLSYKAKMFILNHNKWVSTSIFPVGSHLWGYELWQDLIISIAIGEWDLE